MATIQARISRGHKYWYIVESKRINGKPRPIMLAYLGKADDLLKRLQGLTDTFQLKSYSHGAIAALLKVAQELDVCNIINKYIVSNIDSTTKKPLRNNLTAGATYLLAAIGQLCMPTSKRGFHDWAKNTSLEYLLRTNLSKVDSQHFWDLMGTLPIENISKIEKELLNKVFEQYKIDNNSLFFDTTNFFTYIHTTNTHCTIAKRGKSKQKRMDLRQIGLAMVVSKESLLPLFHLTYEGNRHDSSVFSEVINKLKERMTYLSMDINEHTIVFDRDNNSKNNLKQIKEHGFHYVGGLVPYQHRKLVNEALEQFKEIDVYGNKQQVYRSKQVIWEEERTVIIFISNGLKPNQISWVYNLLEKAKKELSIIQEKVNGKLIAQISKEEIEQKIAKILKDKKINLLINWSLDDDANRYRFNYLVNEEKLKELEDKAGIRILMTDRHNWDTVDIIKAYHGQNFIEQTFKNLKNPYHLSIRPQYHWTDQKIKVHYFICVLGYLLAMLLFKQIKEKVNFTGNLDNFLDYLNNIRLAVMLEASDKSGSIKAIYKLEKASEPEKSLIQALDIEKYHLEKAKLSGVSVYI